MPTVRTAQNNFNAGELSPLLRGRTDQARYFNGLDTCLNWVPLVQGGLRVRGGFKYAGACKSTSANSYLYPFVISATTVYVLEFYNNGIRFWKYDANGEPTQITNGGGAVEVTTTYTTAQIPNIQVAASADVLFIVHASHPPRKLEHVSDTSWLYTTLSFNPPATYEAKTDLASEMYSSAATGNGVTITAATATFLIADVGRDITTNDGGRARILTFVGTTQVTADILEGTFKLVGAPYASGQWWLMGTPQSTIQPAASTFPINVGATFTLRGKIAKDGADRNTFRAADVGKYIHAMGGSMKIVTFNAATNVEARILSILSAGAATPDHAVGGDWTMETDTWDATRGYPSAITMGEQRIIYGGAAGEPDIIRGTVTGDFYNFGPGSADDMALKYVLATEQVNVVKWLHFWDGIIVGSLGSEFTITGASDDPLTPTAAKLRQRTTFGSEIKARTRVGNSLLFVERSGRRVRDFAFNFLTDKYEGDDLTAFSEHLTQTYLFTDQVYQQTPHSLVWHLRSDGTLCALTYYPKEKVLGWSRHSTATAAGTSVIDSFCVVPNPTLDRDDVWITVTRTINGAAARHVEVYDPDWYMDAAKKYSGAATATITGLTHLNGESVMIRGTGGDGIVRLYPAQTVASGEVTGLSPTVTAAEVGIVFTASATTCRIEVPGGTTLGGRKKGFGQLVLRCTNMPVLSTGSVRYKAGGVVSGYAAASVFVIPTGSDMIGTATADGDLIVPVTGYDTDGRVSFQQDLPLGGTVTMLAAEVIVGD